METLRQLVETAGAAIRDRSYSEAEYVLQDAINRALCVAGDDHEMLRTLYDTMGNVLEAQGRDSRAYRMLASTLDRPARTASLVLKESAKSA